VKSSKIIFSGGGTGGHIYPALSIAMEFKRQFPDADLLFVGAQGKMEMQKVPQAGFPIKGIWIDGFQRSFSTRNLLFPLKLMISLIQSFGILVKFTPQVVVGTGGFASGSLLKMAQWMKIPTLIQEQNSYPGVTNKLLAKGSRLICVAFDGMEHYFPKEKIRITGNPVRANLVHEETQQATAKTHFGLDPAKKVLVVLGGSLGAKRINALIVEKQTFFEALDYQLLWQCGALYYDQYKSMTSETVKVLDFIKEMEMLYTAADVIISRAGAGTLSELCCVAKPVLLIPSPNVTANHQYHNAKALVDQQAAFLVQEQDLETDFEATFSSIATDTKVQGKMRQALKKLAKPEAARTIVEHLKTLLPHA